MKNQLKSDTKNIKRLSGATAFILMMGIVSLLSDMTHEGASSISGAYLSLLGASAQAIGFVSGLGALIGYGLRFLTGYVADRTKRYWPMTIIGYSIDLLLIPFLALVPEGGWIWACGLLVFGKIGNAVKKPAKDTMVSFAASEKGEGKGFAYLEFIDQIGAFLGPMLLFAIMLLTSGLNEYKQYAICFATLSVPAILCIALLFLSKRKFPNPEQYEKEIPGNGKISKTYIIYLIAVCIFAFGFIDFPLITAFESEGKLVSTNYLPLLYSGAMLIDAFAALIFGALYDRYGFLSLVISALLSAPFAVLIFLINSMPSMILGIIMWGIGMGAQESIMKAAIASMTDKENRSKGYGIFQLCFGFAWFFGSWLTGALYEISKKAMAIISVSAQAFAAILFIITAISYKRYRNNH